MSAFLSPAFLKSQSDIAIGLSGGPDSFALMHMLHSLCVEHHPSCRIHALTINHNLRDEAAKEAKDLGSSLKKYTNVMHKVLEWDKPKKDARILEAAREARYGLMKNYCNEHNISYLYIAHHMDDQAETFLFRLAKGSGLDGLGGMQPCVKLNYNLSLIRPLLNYTKKDLVEYCEEQSLPYINDPTNHKTEYARPRLRKSYQILEAEGLSAKRLYSTAKRLTRAKDALEWLTDRAVKDCVEYTNNKSLTINLDKLPDYPLEIAVRVLQRAITSLTPITDYAPRLEKIELLAEELHTDSPFRKRTFAQIIFEKKILNDGKKLLLTKEASNS